MDLVSVIIPYYKKRNFVKRAIISVLNQSYNNLEILLIFDDTNLNDFDFLKEIAKLDKRINLIKNNKSKTQKTHVKFNTFIRLIVFVGKPLITPKSIIFFIIVSLYY